MKYTELTIHTTTFGAELVSAILWDYTEDGVAIYDFNDVLELDKLKKGTWDYVDEELLKNKTDEVIVRGYIKETDSKSVVEIEKRIFAIKDIAEFPVGSLEVSKSVVDGDLWREKWKEYFKPIFIGDKIVVVPEWIKYQEKDGEIKVLLDSNMAFGTGEHETTSMCVEYLSKLVQKDDTVLDVGCGSGILGITASKLGAKSVIMTDIDECAVSATTHNMILNGVKNGKVLLKNLLDDESVKGDIIVANIMAEVLIAFAPYIGKNLNDNGTVILSGILTDRKDKVKKAYTENGFNFIEEKIKGEWTAQVYKKENL